MSNTATLRLKMSVTSVMRSAGSDGNITQENIHLSAVYGADGTVNNQWSKWTPNGTLNFTISNPDAFGKVFPGQFYFVELIPTTKDAA